MTAPFRKLDPYGKTISDAVNFYTKHLDAMAKHDATPLSTVVKRFLDEKEREGLSSVHLTDLKNRIARFEIDFGQEPSWLARFSLSICSCRR